MPFKIKNNRRWKAIYESDTMLRLKKKDGTILEVYPENIKNKKKYFVAVSDKDSIRDKEFNNKEEAITFANKWIGKN